MPEPHISDLIAHLQALQKEHGDLEIGWAHPDLGRTFGLSSETFPSQTLRVEWTAGLGEEFYEHAEPGGKGARRILVIDPTTM